MRILYFAQCADWMNAREAEVTLKEPVRLIDLIRASSDLAPIERHLKSLEIAINRVIADAETEVCDDDEVAFLPPISGG